MKSSASTVNLVFSVDDANMFIVVGFLALTCFLILAIKFLLSQPTEEVVKHVEPVTGPVYETHAPVILITSLFTDVRIFKNQTKSFKNLYVVDLNRIEPPEDSLDSYAKLLAKHLVFEDEQFKKMVIEDDQRDNFYLGGFCVGGMTSLLLCNHLRKLDPRLQCKGVFLVSSCASFVECVAPEQISRKNKVMSVLSRNGLKSLVKFYLYMNRTDTIIAHIINKLMSKSYESSESLLSRSDEKLLIQMTLDRDAEFVTRLLNAEFGFNQKDLDTSSLPTIHHIHGDTDYLIPLERVRAFQNEFVKKNNVQYELIEVLPGDHYLPLTQPLRVNEIIYSVINS